MPHDYKLSYDLHFNAGHFDGQAEKEKGRGATDALLVVSCIEHEEGSYSQMHFSVDGATNGQMTTGQEAKAWSLLGAALLERSDLAPTWRAAMESSLDIIRKGMGVKS